MKIGFSKRFYHFCYWHINCKNDFILRSLANGNCMCSSISLLLVGNKSFVDEFDGKHCYFESAELSERDWFVNI